LTIGGILSFLFPARSITFTFSIAKFLDSLKNFFHPEMNLGALLFRVFAFFVLSRLNLFSRFRPLTLGIAKRAGSSFNDNRQANFLNPLPILQIRPDLTPARLIVTLLICWTYTCRLL
jgi:hypothetical protein